MSGLLGDMGQKQWSAVDRYFVEKLALADPVLIEALARNEASGLPRIDVSPPQGKFLHLIARMIGAKRILEIGTLGACSTIWLARALPEDGLIVTLEYDPRHARSRRRTSSVLASRAWLICGWGPRWTRCPALKLMGLDPLI